MCFDKDKDIEYVVQLPTRDFAGNIQLRFEGTTFNLKVCFCLFLLKLGGPLRSFVP